MFSVHYSIDELNKDLNDLNQKPISQEELNILIKVVGDRDLSKVKKRHKKKAIKIISLKTIERLRSN